MTPSDSTHRSELGPDSSRGESVADGFETLTNAVPAPDALRPAGDWPAIGGYEIMGILGRGGMGIVYKARQVRPHRIVALKMIRAESAQPEDFLRFLNEAEAIARLQHPNIIQVFEVGEGLGRPFFTMELAEGDSLARKLAGTPLEGMEAARLVAILARAMQYAHDHQIIHRDLKPGNILLTQDGTPKISDFGLAKRLEEGTGLTASHALLGTPSYMAPEQASGTPKKIGPATDIYALGTILYELLTGRPPFKAATNIDTILQVLSDEPLSPRRVLPKLPSDLETICMKCLEKEPVRRYASALALADDLERFQHGESIRAKPASILQRAVKLGRRRPAAATALGLTVCMVLGLGLFTVLLFGAYDRATAAKEQAVLAQQQAQDKEKEAVESRDEAQRRASVSEFLTGLFQSSDPFGLDEASARPDPQGGNQMTALQLLDIGRKHLEQLPHSDPIVRASLLDMVGSLYRSMGYYDRAEPMLLESRQLRRKFLAPGHQDLATSLFDLGWLRHDQGQFAEAESLYREALAIREKAFGHDDLRTAAVMLNLGWVISHQYDRPTKVRLEESERLLREVVAVRRRLLGEKSREVGLAMAGLAVCLLGQEQQAKALKLLGEAMVILERPENKDSVSSGVMTYFQAVLARKAGRFDEARRLHWQVIERARALLGEAHPATLLLMGDYAGLLRIQGDWDGAEKIIRKTIELGRKSPLYWHPVSVDALVELADLDARRSNFKEAEDLYREALNIAQHIKKPDRLEKARTGLRDFLRSQKRPSEAAVLDTPKP